MTPTSPYDRMHEVLKALVVENDPADLDRLRENLSREEGLDIDLVSVSNLQEGLEQCGKTKVDVILLDLSLPEYTGTEALSKFLGHVPNLPVIVLLGAYDESLVLEVLRRGAQDYLVKSEIDGKTLLRTVRHAIERKRLSEELRKKGERYASLFHSAADPILILDLLGYIEAVNPAAEAISGYRLDELAGKHFTKAGLLGTSSLSTALKEYVLIKAGQSRLPFELDLIRKDGGTLTVEAHAQLIQSEGKETGIEVVFRDMTDRKRLEHEARMTQEKYRTIFENSAVAITVTNAEEKIVSWNKFAEDLLGMTPEDLYLKPVSSLYPAEDWRKIRSYNIRKKGIEPHVETQVVKKSGAVIDVELSVTVLKNTQGQILGSIGIMKDITRRKMAERALRSAEERYRTIFDNSAAAITVTDANERIVSWNKFAERFLGMGQEDLYLLPVSSLYPPEEWAKIRKLNVRKKGMQHRFETKIIKKDGTMVDADISISVLKDLDGSIIGSIGIIKDITERKALDKMKDQFVSLVSHELRTPIFVIQEGIAQLLDGIVGEISDDQRKILSTALINTKRIARIVNDLLDISKIEAGRLALEREFADLMELVRGVVQGFQVRAQKKGLALKEKFSCDRLTVYVDKDKITQVLVNLIGNALKFTEKGFVEVGITERESWVECFVADSGRGIDEKDIGKVFDKFQQFGRPKTGSEKGTGLGLSICKGLVELHHGKIWVESHSGQGTKVVFILPKYTGSDLFKEYIAESFTHAVHSESSVSFVLAKLTNHSALSQVMGLKKLTAVLGECEEQMKKALIRRGDRTVVVGDSVLLILPAASKSDAVTIQERTNTVMHEVFLGQESGTA
ncbi:MAG: PAS domain S-box protein, partial [Candidatus Omnitrophica bacterium]|nr:PAS domain S-box protein [Candidatus Omnitrophota bacterium]